MNLGKKRRSQAQDWFSFLVDEGLRQWFYDRPQVKETLPQLRKQLDSGKQSPTAAAAELLDLLNLDNPHN